MIAMQTKYKQLTFDFYDSQNFSDMQVFNKHLYEIGLSVHAVRKSIFAKHNTLQRKFLELEERLAIIEANICKHF